MQILNENEAPDGFRAVLKSDYRKHEQNFCNFCEWRNECQDVNTDKSISNHRCMSDTVILENGNEVQRQDCCSVLFLKR